MKKRICVLTGTRAEYGLLKRVILKLKVIPELDVRVVVTGAHLSPEFGLTYQEIEKDRISIDEKIEILLSGDTAASISKSMGLAIIGFADYLAKSAPDMLLVLGDRYETLSVCCAAMNQRIPIAHLYGGETTEGAVDESIRHAITKLSYLHFTSTEQHRNRVIQLGEQPERVFCVGSLGIENILQEELLSKSELEIALDFKLDKPYAVVTFHPVTLEENNSADQFKALLSACFNHKEMKFIFSKANADTNGRIINEMIDAFVEKYDNAIAFDSLGMVRYLSALKYSVMVMGNSSSGLVEAPSLGIPTVNIGDRQKGRLQSDSVINCQPILGEIEKAMSFALTEEVQTRAKKTVNPYGNGEASEKIAETIKDFLLTKTIDLKKRFFDLR